MARPAPGAARTVEVITFLSKHPGRAFGLSELARRLTMNKATAHALLTTLEGVGWLQRDPIEMTYRLGPELIAIGDAAAGAERHAVELARPGMRRLSDKLELQLVAGAAMGDRIVTVAVEGPIGGIDLGVRPGHQVPFAPPFGAVHVAWEGDEASERWMQRVVPDLDPEHRDVYRRALESIRRRGYAVSLAQERRIDPGASLSAIAGDIDYVVNELASMHTHQLGTITAPVFDSGGRAVLSITLTAFSEHLSGLQIPELAQHLVDLTDSVTVAIGGRKPT